MKITTILNDDLTLTEDSKISGVVNGDVFTKANIEVKISGVVNGDVHFSKGCFAKISGAVNGDIFKENETVELKISGSVSGDIFTNNKKDKKTENNSKYPFNNSVITSNNSSIIIGNNNSIQNKFSSINNGCNISFIGNKQVRIKNNGSVSIVTKGGKSFVNGIDLDTLTPDEDGIYTI